MIGIIEFKKESHERHISKLHKIKEELCVLLKEIEEEAYEDKGDRRPMESFDERGMYRGYFEGVHGDRDNREQGRMHQGYRQGGDSGYTHPHHPDYDDMEFRGKGRYGY